MAAFVAVTGIMNTGGATFIGKQTPNNPKVQGMACVQVGDTVVCPGSVGPGPGGYGNHPVDSEGNRLPMPSTVLDGSRTVFVGGVPVALEGSMTSCGHPLIKSPQNIVIA